MLRMFLLLVVATRSFCSHERVLVEDGFQLMLKDGRPYIEFFKCGWHDVISCKRMIIVDGSKKYTTEFIQAGLLEQKNTKLVDSVGELLSCLREQKSEKSRNLVLLANIDRMPKLCWQDAVDIIKSFEDYNFPCLQVFIKAEFETLEDLVLTVNNFNSDKPFKEREFSVDTLGKIVCYLSKYPQIIELLKFRFPRVFSCVYHDYKKTVNARQDAYFDKLLALPVKERLEEVRSRNYFCIPLLQLLRVFDHECEVEGRECLRLQVLDIVVKKKNFLYRDEVAAVKLVPVIEDIDYVLKVLCMFNSKCLRAAMSRIELIYNTDNWYFYNALKNFGFHEQKKFLKEGANKGWLCLFRIVGERLRFRFDELNIAEFSFLNVNDIFSFIQSTDNSRNIEILLDRMSDLGVCSFVVIEGALSHKFVESAEKVKSDKYRNKFIAYNANLCLSSWQVKKILSQYTNKLEKYKALRLILVDDEILGFKNKKMQDLVAKFYEKKKDR